MKDPIQMESDGKDYVLRVLDDPNTVDGKAWNALLARQTQPTPFMRIEYLRALHDSGSAVRETGWVARLLTLEKNGQMVAACVAYAKNHSFGEYVFDWAWADAYRRHGLNYYPKLVMALPFTPVPGSRLLADDDRARSMLVHGLRELSSQAGWSSAHALFLSEEDRGAFAKAGWLMREGVQFHWCAQDSSETPAGDPFTAFLSTLQREKRKKIQQERRRVAEAGVRFDILEGEAIGTAQWDFFHHCYTLTYAAHHSTPYLTRDFFSRMASSMPEHWLMFVARVGSQQVAASLVAIDREGRAAWGRYWGATQHIPCLHFEACYHQPLQWCMENGFARFEGGAQGEHKMARGLLPVRTFSAHWLRDGRFSSAVADFLCQESAGIDGYVHELEQRSPFKRAG